MSASGSTPHLHLSQYSGTDHPSYVSDYTEDMGRIDTGFNLAQTNALTALNRVAALEQSIGSAGAVGQTVVFSTGSVAADSVVQGNLLTLGFNNPPLSMMTRNAEPADVPWTWQPVDDTVELIFNARGVYRVTVEAYAEYQPPMNVSSAQVALDATTHYVPFARLVDEGVYSANGSFVIPYDGGGYSMYLSFSTSFNDSTVSNARVQCYLTVDVEQLSTEYPAQPSPGSRNRQ